MALGDGAVLPCMRDKRRLRVAVIGDDDGPLRDVVVVVRQDGQFQRDVTDASGQCEFQGVPVDDAKLDITLAELDADAWETTAQHTLREELATSTALGKWSNAAAPADAGPATHTVDHGDCLLSIAYAHGLLPETLWKHPANAKLWRAHHRKTVLSIGQTIQIPARRVRWEPAKPGTVHVVHRIGVPVVMTIRVVENGSPCADASYVLALKRANGEDLPHRSGITDADGFLRAPTPPDVVSGTLVVTSPDGVRHWSMALRVGDLRPADETDGANARLQNLGYRSAQDGATGLDQGALGAFLSADPEKATLDDDVAQKLAAAHLT